MLQLHPWPDYIIRRGLLLSCALLASALILSVWADAHSAAFFLLRRLAAYQQSSATVVLAAALLGGLLLEDGLRKGAPRS